jgi:hypothetical protein
MSNSSHNIETFDKELSYEVRIGVDGLVSTGMDAVNAILQERGITFDTGVAINDGKPIMRSWFLDWSLAGATPQTVMSLLKENDVPFEVLIDIEKEEDE